MKGFDHTLRRTYIYLEAAQRHTRQQQTDYFILQNHYFNHFEGIMASNVFFFTN